MPDREELIDQLSVYDRLSLACGAVIAVTAGVAGMLEQPDLKPIQATFEEVVEEVVKQIENRTDELISFGEAYD